MKFDSQLSQGKDGGTEQSDDSVNYQVLEQPLVQIDTIQTQAKKAVKKMPSLNKAQDLLDGNVLQVRPAGIPKVKNQTPQEIVQELYDLIYK